jgi:hypothetical protein
VNRVGFIVRIKPIDIQIGLYLYPFVTTVLVEVSGSDQRQPRPLYSLGKNPGFL